MGRPSVVSDEGTDENDDVGGKPSVVRDEGTDENGEAGAPDGANTGFDAVVSEAGADTSPCARAATEHKLTANPVKIKWFRMDRNMA